MPQSQLFYSIFHKNPDDANSRDFIQDVKNEYPYFLPANYFLLKQTAETAADYPNIVATNLLHITSPYLLNFLLAKDFESADLAILTAQHQSNEETVEAVPEKVENISEPVSEIKVVPEIVQTMPDELKTDSTEKPKAELIFEPLYTTDYFASQGIKLSEEAKPVDKLGKQLKSFTEWLKTMKKVHESTLLAGNENSDAAVQTFAEKSNKNAEIVTEPMAEAYVAQGKLAKAMEIYLKLSLLNPGKSAFFAAKIEQLKEK
jgi:hypothetical protein